MLKQQYFKIISSKTNTFTRISMNQFSTSQIQLFYTNFKLNEENKDNLISKASDYETFKNNIQRSQVPIIVDFYASWCGPCKLLTPQLEEAIQKHGQFKLIKVNVDQVPEAARDYQVSSVPTVMAFKDGQPIHSFIGFQNLPGIIKFFNAINEKIKN